MHSSGQSNEIRHTISFLIAIYQVQNISSISSYRSYYSILVILNTILMTILRLLRYFPFLFLKYSYYTNICKIDFCNVKKNAFKIYGIVLTEQIVDRLEHEVALRVGLGLHRLGKVGEVAGHVGHETGEMRARAHEIGAHLGRGRGAEVPADRFDEGLVRDDVLLVAAAREHRATFVVQDARELDREAGLPHSRVASEQHDVPAVGRVRLRPPRAQRRELRLATDERRVGVERRRKRHRGTREVVVGRGRRAPRLRPRCSTRAVRGR